MALFKHRCIFLLLVSFFSPSIAAFDDATALSCGVYSEADENDDKKDGEEGADEEEPDCE